MVNKKRKVNKEPTTEELIKLVKDLQEQLKKEREEKASLKLRFYEQKKAFEQKQKKEEKRFKHDIEQESTSQTVPKFIKKQLTQSDTVRYLQTSCRINMLNVIRNETPAKMWLSIYIKEINTIEQTLEQVLLALRRAIANNLQGQPDKPWFGTATIDGNATGLFLAVIEDLQINPSQKTLNEIDEKFGKRNTYVHGEIIIRWQEVFEVTNNKGNRVKRKFSIKGFPSKHFIIGKGIESTEE